MTNVYLACPLTDSDVENMEKRFNLASKLAAKIMLTKNINVFSPITHGYTLCKLEPELPVDFKFWQNHCLSLLSYFDELWVIKASGWKLSKGVSAEIQFAKNNGIVIKYLDCSGDFCNV